MVNDTVRRTVFDACRPEWLRIDGDVYTWEMEFSMPIGLRGFEWVLQDSSNPDRFRCLSA